MSHTLSLPTYDIQIGPIGAPHQQWLAGKAYAGFAVVCDENTAVHCLPTLRRLLPEAARHVITVPAGEAHKNLDTCRQIWESLFRLGVGRRWCVLNLGGGVIGDMGGFCAGTFKRGIDFIQIPTTLLAQVDASVGGKLGIDFFELKNSVGLFRDPAAVWIDPTFLDTLADRELRSGFAEVLKHALIADRDQWDRLHALDPIRSADLARLILESVAIKRRIVATDPHERGLRKALNFGHTVGHAIESYYLDTPERLLHGEAIAYGMVIEAWLSHQLTGLPVGELREISAALTSRYGHRVIPEAAFAELIGSMRQDKKNETSAINFSLLSGIGSAVVNQTAPEERILSAIRYWNDAP